MRIEYTLDNLEPEYRVDSQTFDLFIYAVGYEKRSIFFRSQKPNAAKIYGIDYNCPGRGNYDENLIECQKYGDETIVYNGREIFFELKSTFKSLMEESLHPRNIAIDVSCLDRTLMSYVILALLQVTKRNDKIVFLYTPSKFTEPPLYLSPLKKFGPAIPELSGFVGNPYKSRALIMGLGYEYGAALNVFDILEPEFAHLFYPIGEDQRFLPHVMRANFEFEFGLNEYDVSSYKISDPVSVHGQIRDIIYSLRPMYTVMIVPFGPKLFSALGILLCINAGSDCSFMRYSLEEAADLSTVESSGKTCGFTMTLA